MSSTVYSKTGADAKFAAKGVEVAKRLGLQEYAIPVDGSGNEGASAALTLLSSAVGINVRTIGLDGQAYGVYNGQTVARFTDGATPTFSVAGLTFKPYEVGIVATGGTYTLTVGGQTTSALAYNAAASAIKTALEALSSVGAGNVDVIDGNGTLNGSGTTGPFCIVLKNAAKDQAVTGTSSLTGTSNSLTVSLSLILTVAQTHTGFVLWTTFPGPGGDRTRVWTAATWNQATVPTYVLSARTTTLTGFARPQQVAGKTWLMFGEYTLLTPSTALKRWLSVDGGATWTNIHSTTVVDSAVNSHSHTGLITPLGRIYVSEGDGANAGFYYSDDQGGNWVPVKTDSTDATVYDLAYMQPTAMIDFTTKDDRISVCPDRGSFPPGVWDLDASSHVISRNYDLAGTYELTPGAGTTAAAQYGHAQYAKRGREAYVMLPDTGSGSKVSVILATGDAGRTWWKVATVSWGSSGGSLSTGICGVDKDGYLYMTGLNLPAPYVSATIRMKALKWKWVGAQVT